MSGSSRLMVGGSWAGMAAASALDKGFAFSRAERGAGFHDIDGPYLSPDWSSDGRIGLGRVTVFTHSNYINDPRRRWYGLGGRR